MQTEPVSAGAAQGHGPVMVLAPTGSDATSAMQLLHDAGIAAQAFGSLAQLTRALDGTSGPAMIDSEALANQSLDPLRQTLQAQPAWSDLPIILLAPARSAAAPRQNVVPGLLADLANLLVLERPIGRESLLSAVLSALRARERQFHLRDQFETMAHQAEALRAVQADRDRQQALAEDRALFAEQMMAIVSHDLRNPLSVIRMSSVLLDRLGLTPPQQTALRRLDTATDRATRLIADLLDFSRSRLSGGLAVERKLLDVHGLVRDTLGDLRIAHPDRVVEHRSIGSGACLGSADRLGQLVGNLVTNAITYGAPERPVVVTSAVDEATFSVAVHNEGPAIPDALRPRLFAPMMRGTPGGHAGSVGLGLFIVREIARAHGGEVGVNSTAEGGTTFRATFSRAQAVRAGPA